MPNPYGLLLVGAWLLLCAPVLPWMAHGLLRQDGHLGLALVAVVGALLFSRQRLRGGALSPQRAPGTLPALLITAALMLLCRRILPLHLLQALFALAGSYLLLRLHLTPAAWRRGLPLCLLLMAALPLRDHLDVLVGFPARTLAAAFARAELSLLGVPVKSVETLLVLENGLTNVDIPCSGVRGLWTFSLFFLFATWLSDHPLNRRWIGVGLLVCAALVLGNGVRVAILTLLLDHPDVAAMVHVPIGTLNFLLGCGAGLWLLRRGGRAPRPAPAPRPPVPREALAGTAAVLLGLALLGGRPLAEARAPGAAAEAPDLPAAAGLRGVDLPLSRDEQALVEGGRARKWQLSAPFTGSLFVVRSREARTQHPPELCLAAAGLTVLELSSIEVRPGLVARHLRLRDAAGGLHHGYYWFQSGAQVTERLLWRVLISMKAALRGAPPTWDMISVLLPDSAGEPATRELLARLYEGAKR